LNLRLFYSNYNGAAAQANAPDLSNIQGIFANNLLTFSANVTGTVSAGVQVVWVTYTFDNSTTWQSLDLAPVNGSPGQYSANFSLPNGQTYQNLHFMIQAASGVGLVTLASNGGQFYTPTPPPPPPPPAPLVTSVSILQSTPVVDYLGSPVVQAQVYYTDPINGQQPLTNQPIAIEIGNQRVIKTSNGNGQVSLNLGGQNPYTLNQNPGNYTLNVSYAGSDGYAASLATANFIINKVPTSLILANNGNISAQYSDPINASVTLKDVSGAPVGLKWVVFVGTNASNQTFTSSAQTNNNGIAQLTTPQWPAGVYSYTVYFSGQIPQIGTLSDNVYASSLVVAANSTITITAEDATVNYIGATTLYASNVVFTAQVAQTNDGSPGNLGLAQVRFDLSDSNNQPVRVITTTAGGGGIASVSVSGLTAGNYNLRMTVLGGFFSSPLTGPVQITLLPGTGSACLTVTSNTENGSGACGTLLGAILAANSAGGGQVTINFNLAQPTLPISITTDLSAYRLSNVNGMTIMVNGGCIPGSNLQPGTYGVILQSGTGAGANGLYLGSGVTVQGLWIRGFSGFAVDIQGDNNTLSCNWLGKSSTGDPASYANGGGIQLGTVGGSSANGNSLGQFGVNGSGNLISGNTGTGLVVNRGGNNHAYYNWVGYTSGGQPLKNGSAVKILPGGNLVFNRGNRLNSR